MSNQSYEILLIKGNNYVQQNYLIANSFYKLK